MVYHAPGALQVEHDRFRFAEISRVARSLNFAILLSVALGEPNYWLYAIFGGNPAAD